MGELHFSGGVVRPRGCCFALILLLAAVPRGTVAQTNTVYDFLRSDMNARAAGLAGSFVSITDDPTTLFYNPASLGTLTCPRGTVGFFKNLMDINAGSIAYGQRLNDSSALDGTIAGGIIYQNYGTFAETDESGETIGSFSAGDLAFVAGYANTLDENLYWGASVKYIYSSIAGYSSSALAGDFGILYNLPESRLSIGASIRNLGFQLKTYLGTREDLPVDATLGASFTPKGLPLLLNFDLHKLNQTVENFGQRFRSFTLGGEFTVSRVILLRFGFNNEQRKDLVLGSTSGMTGFSGGLGINVRTYRLDYAISSLGNIGNLHRISVSSTF